MKHEKTKIELKLYGLPQEAGDVRGDVFVKKMDILLKSLRAADQHQNGQKTLEYLIKGMEYGSAYTRMSEFQYNTEKVPMVSAIEAVHSVIESVKDGKGIPSDTPLALAKSVANLGKGCEKTFSHGEIGLVGRAETAVRLDVSFAKRANRAYREFIDDESAPALFEGVARGTFKGTLKVIDLRGTVTSAKLIVAVGGAELDCTCNSVTIENLKEALDQTVIVSGRVHYDGKQKLPEHIEIKKIEILGNEKPNLLKWSGAFKIPHKTSEDVW